MLTSRRPEDLERMMDAALGSARSTSSSRAGESWTSIEERGWTPTSGSRPVGWRRSTSGSSRQPTSSTRPANGSCRDSSSRTSTAAARISLRLTWRTRLQRGTTATVCDFQEHYCYGGMQAARWAIDRTQEAGLRIFFLAPLQQFVMPSRTSPGSTSPPATCWRCSTGLRPWQSTSHPGGTLQPRSGDARDRLRGARARTDLLGACPRVQGPSPAGLRDHRGVVGSRVARRRRSLDEARARNEGHRDGSAVPDLPELVGLASEPNAAWHMSMGSDEVDPLDLVENGHMDHKIHLAVQRGVDPSPSRWRP